MDTPPATGALERFELPRLVRALRPHRFTGSIRLQAQGEEIRVFLREGVCRFCLGLGKQHSFAAWLLRTRLLSGDILKAYLQRARQEGVRLEELLVRTGKLTPAQLRTIQSGVSHHTFADACATERLAYALDSSPPPPIVDQFRLQPERAVCEYVLRWDAVDHVTVVSRRRDVRLVRGPLWEEVAPAAEAVFGDAMRGLAERVAQGVIAAEEAQRGDVETAAKVIYALTCLGALVAAPAQEAPRTLELRAEVAPLGRLPLDLRGHPDLAGLRSVLEAEGFPIGDDVAGPAEPIEAAPAPGGPLSEAITQAVEQAAAEEEPEVEEAPPASGGIRLAGLKGLVPPVEPTRRMPTDPIQRSIHQLRRRLAEEDPFSVLGVAPGAPLSEVKDSYVAVRARYDRDAFNVGDLPDEIRQDLTLVERGLDRAVDELLDPAQREVHEASVEGGMSAVEVAAYFQADASYREGRRLQDQGDHRGALAAFRRAQGQNGGEPEYHLWCAQATWDALMAEEAWDDAGRSEVERLLGDALVLRPDHEQAQLLLARVYLERGQGKAALQLYQQVLDGHPANAEAQAAVRELAGYEDGGDRPGRLGGMFNRRRKPE